MPRPSEIRPVGPGRRHHRGDVPTPPELARRLVEGFDPAGPAARGPWLDPACGEGNLLVAARELAGGAADCFGIETDPAKLARARERLAGARGPSGWGPDRTLVQADALAPTTRWPSGTHVLANPPWVSFSGRHAPGADAPPLHHRGPGGWPALHAAFLARAARHLAEHGTEGRFLLPAAVATGPAYAPLRAEVERHAHLRAAPEALDEDAFPGVHEPATLLHLLPGASAGDEPWTPHPASPADDALALALAGHPRAPEGTFADPGLHTGNAARLLVHDEPGPGRVPLRVGRDLAAYRLGRPRQFLDTAVRPSPEHRFRRKTRADYAGFPVLLRQTADRPIAALHEPGEAFRNSLLAARAIPELDPAVLVAVLNHPWIARWHRARHADARQRRFPQVKVGHLRALPLPFAARREAPAAHDAIAKRVRALRPDEEGFAERVAQLEQRVVAAFALEPGLARALDPR